MQDKLIGIVGCGFVGSAVAGAFKKTIISDPKVNAFTVEDILAEKPDAIFICVPTPSAEDGSVNGKLVRSIIDKIPEGQLTVVKSTITPDWLPIGKKGLVYNPEFLTQANAQQEFLNPAMNVIGGSKDDVKALLEVYSFSNVAECPNYLTDIKTACFVKYTINSFLATKVTFMNELHSLFTDYTDGDWNAFMQIVSSDPRIGKSHLNVPNNGEYGFGGACFPKDTDALLKFAGKNGHDLNVLNAAVLSNKAIRTKGE